MRVDTSSGPSPRPTPCQHRFVDPTNDVTGLGRYVTALGLLFDPQLSRVSATFAARFSSLPALPCSGIVTRAAEGEDKAD
eukprot:364912-Chlamydomonas_euryale.AAC.11